MKSKQSLVALAALAAVGGFASARQSCDRETGHMNRALNAGGLLANIDAADLNTGNVFMHSHGNALRVCGQAAVGTAPAENDLIRLCRIPAGAVIDEVAVANTDMDTHGTPTLAVSVGFEPVDSAEGPTADHAYFAASGQTILQAANDGKVYRKFTPKKFEKDVYLVAKVTATAATFAAGTLYATASGRVEGIK